MGFWNFLRRRKSENQSVQSIDKSVNQSLESIEQSSISKSVSKSLDVEKDSLQLGLAAGYTARTLRSIENSLERIESSIVNKEWLLGILRENIAPLIKKLEEHEINSDKRLQTLLEISDSMHKLSPEIPETLKPQYLSQMRKIESQLTPKMEQLVSVIKEVNEISYSDLAKRLDISESGLRSLMSLAVRRGAPIERLNIYGRGWVRLKIASNQPKQSLNQSNQAADGTKQPINQNNQSSIGDSNE